MEKTIEDFKDYEGIDANLETSLYEYGLIWAKGIEGHEKYYRFIYGVAIRETETREMEYYQFDWADILIDCDPEKEWGWVNWNEVAQCSGMTKKQLLKLPLPMIVETLVSYYGHEEIFGSSYYPFPIYKDIFVECGSCGSYHREKYHGDCRNDLERYSLEDIPENCLVIDIEENGKGA